jgi:hypothetical protein
MDDIVNGLTALVGANKKRQKEKIGETKSPVNITVPGLTRVAKSINRHRLPDGGKADENLDF